MSKFLDENGLLYVWTIILQTFVAKTAGKDLSSNDYSDADKEKLAGLFNYVLPTATAETLGGVKVGSGLGINNGVLYATGGGEADSVDWTNISNKPTVFPPDVHNHTVSQITDFATSILNYGYQTEAQVLAAITAAVGQITGIDIKKVAVLPATGEKGTIYLVPAGGSEAGNVYDEYIYVDGAWEKIGTTAVDLSGYWSKTELIAITNAEIDNIMTL